MWVLRISRGLGDREMVTHARNHRWFVGDKTDLDDKKARSLVESDLTQWAYCDEDGNLLEKNDPLAFQIVGEPVEKPKVENPLAAKLRRTSEIKALVELPGIGDVVAERLWEAGFKTKEDLLKTENRNAVLQMIPAASLNRFVEGVLSGDEE